MKKHMVRVEIPGKLIFFKNRKIRTPFALELTDLELNKFRFALHAAGVENYTISDVKKKDDNDVEELIVIPQKEEVIIEDLEVKDISEPTTILEKLLRDDKNGE